MTRRDGSELLVLAAIWGASFLFMRIGVPEFGSFSLMLLRVGLGALLLLPVALRGGANLRVLWQRWPAVLLIGATSTIVPFWLWGYASHTLSAGFLSITNAGSSIWAMLIGWVWLKDRPSASRLVGMIIGLAGIVVLVWDKLSFSGTGLAVLATMLAPMLYGIASNATKRYLSDVPALSVAVGALLGGAAVAVIPGVLAWPDHPVSWTAWGAALALSLVCTGFAYLLYFRLIARMGPTGGSSVTFMIPITGTLWGTLFLGETITLRMLAGAAVILVGTALAMGLVRLPHGTQTQ